MLTYTDLPWAEGVHVILHPSHAAQFAARQAKPWRVNASEVSALFGENTYLSPFALAQLKLGNELPAKDEKMAKRGHKWERFVCQCAVDELNEAAPVDIRYELVWLPEHCGIVNEKYPSLAATPDAMVVCWQRQELATIPGERKPALASIEKVAWYGPLEAKKVHWQKRDEWEGEPPVGYLVQNQVQMLCCGATKGVVAGMISDDLSVSVLDLFEPLCNTIIEATTTFLENLHAGILPPVDGHEATGRALGAFFRAKGETPMDLPEELWHLPEELEQAKQDVKQAEAHKDEIANRLKLALGENTIAMYPGGKVTWKSQGGNVTKLEVDTGLVEALVKAGIPYKAKVSAETRVLRLTTKKEK
jgi:predicted phage-related endonuclease